MLASLFWHLGSGRILAFLNDLPQMIAHRVQIVRHEQVLPGGQNHLFGGFVLGLEETVRLGTEAALQRRAPFLVEFCRALLVRECHE